MRHVYTEKNTDVICEIVELASKHTGIPARCDEVVISPRVSEAHVFIDEHVAKYDDIKMGVFHREFKRLKEVICIPLQESVMANDEPVYQGSMYVVDGKPKMFIDGANMTVGLWKRKGVRQVCTHDAVGRALRLPLSDKPVVEKPVGKWDNSGRTIVQAKRRSRPSNKIRKVGG